MGIRSGVWKWIALSTLSLEFMFSPLLLCAGGWFFVGEQPSRRFLTGGAGHVHEKIGGIPLMLWDVVAVGGVAVVEGVAW